MNLKCPVCNSEALEDKNEYETHCLDCLALFDPETKELLALGVR